MPELKKKWEKIKTSMSSAFSVEPEEPFSPNQRQQEIIEKLATWIDRKRLHLPAIMFLESVKPLNYLGSQVLVFFYPFVTAFLNSKDYKEFQQLLEYRESIGYIIEAIEKKEKQRENRKKQPSQSSHDKE